MKKSVEQLRAVLESEALLDDSGELYGTLCHFDASEQGLSDDDFDMLKQAAKVIPGYLPKAV